MKVEILIIGAGPIGCYTARLLKEKGYRDINIIEEHSEIGRPVHCAGLISREAFSETKVTIDKEVIINRIDGAEFFRNGDSFRINRKDVALVINREKFDRALGAGLDISFNTRFVGIEKDGLGYLVETDKGEYRADIVIGASGASSSLRMVEGFKERIEYLRGVQFRIKYDKCDKNFVQVYLRNQFFAWIIPEAIGIARVGIISDNPYHDLTEFIEEKIIKAEVLEKFAGIVPQGECLTQNGNLFLVGDAACQVKPLTYGGIYYGMRCAEILVDCISAGRLGDYEKRWKQRFNAEIQAGLKIKKIYECLSQDNITKVFNFLKKNTALLESFGDFENHSKTISLLFRNSRFPAFLGEMLLGILKDIRV